MATNAAQGEPGLRQTYGVTYYRQGQTDNWKARTERGELLRGVTAKGAVGYSTALWAGESQADAKHASVHVHLEVHPAFGDPDMLIHPSLWPQMRDAARKLADGLFRENHPGAVIEHDEDSGY